MPNSDSGSNVSFESLVLSRLDKLTEQAQETKELIVKYAERVDGMGTRLTKVEDTQKEQATAIATHSTNISTIQKVLGAIGVGIISLIGGLLLYFFNHR